jgi:hypothetical protein
MGTHTVRINQFAGTLKIGLSVCEIPKDEKEMLNRTNIILSEFTYLLRLIIYYILEKLWLNHNRVTDNTLNL